MKTGVHLWIGKGLDMAVNEAKSLGCDCFQVFLHNPRSWKSNRRQEKEILKFRQGINAHHISPVVVHMPYLPNLASPDKRIAAMSIGLLEKDVEEARSAGADFYVIHPGSHRGAGRKAGLENIARNLKFIVSGTPEILLENTAGQGNTIGGKWEDFVYLFDKTGAGLGLCLDTAHAFQAGYDIRNRDKFYSMCRIIDKNLGLSSIKLVHANDSASAMGSHLDRHEHIGKGFLGRATFEIMAGDEHFGNLPFIIETPKSDAHSDRRNLQILREAGMKHGKYPPPSALKPMPRFQQK